MNPRSLPLTASAEKCAEDSHGASRQYRRVPGWPSTEVFEGERNRRERARSRTAAAKNRTNAMVFARNQRLLSHVVSGVVEGGNGIADGAVDDSESFAEGVLDLIELVDRVDVDFAQGSLPL